MAHLIPENVTDTTDHIAIPEGQCLLGRHPDCDIHDLFDGNERVSRRHAAILQRGEKYLLEDLGSQNGTFLNGIRISRPESLADGDTLGICGVELQFSDDAGKQRPGSHEVVIDEDESSAHVMASIGIGLSTITPPERIAGASAERKLEGLVRLLDGLAASVESDVLLDNLLEGLFRVFPAAERGFVAMGLVEDQLPEIRATRLRESVPDLSLRISRTITQQVLNTQQAMLSADVQKDVAYSGSQSIAAANIRSFLCAPLIDNDGVAIGIVQLETHDASRPFSSQDLEVLAAVTPQVSLALNFSELHERAVRQAELDRDLELARKVQLGLLPHQSAKLDGYDFYDFYEAASHVGGDYYDYVPLPSGRMAVVLADVSGKGVSASLLMAKISGELRLLLATRESPADAVAVMNDSLCESGIAGRFVTLVVAVIDSESGVVTLVNAGHPSPLLRSADGSVREVGAEMRGVAIGLFPCREYRPFDVSLAAGDSLSIFTDGFTEAMDADGELYGDDRLEAALSQPSSDLASLGAGVLADLRAFVGDHPQSDDMCLVSFERLACE